MSLSGWTGRSPSPGTLAPRPAGWSAPPLAVADGADSGRTGSPRRPPTIHGRVLLAGDTSVTLDIEGDRVEFDYDELGPGRVQVEFARPGEAGGTEVGPILDSVRVGDEGSRDGH